MLECAGAFVDRSDCWVAVELSVDCAKAIMGKHITMTPAIDWYGRHKSFMRILLTESITFAARGKQSPVGLRPPITALYTPQVASLGVCFCGRVCLGRPLGPDSGRVIGVYHGSSLRQRGKWA